ncbi:MAG: DAK2 domain-containing protein [Chloroflexi bacterium]|nr:MAG: DAK2 domain-containing protein [Chloroflexota bacterium]MBL1196392.1 DAK2 domain-containing protein [Chloroflexota bacterium]NOH13687.1 DAK2 domain-containing protein [Chloroflexota bacterium]
MSDTLELRRGTTRRQVFSQHPIDGQAVKRLVYAGMAWLKTNQAVVNALNVFPVPDGDTGTNMLLTMQSAINEIEDSGETHMGKMLGAVAQGALMGARGNSGVILSQLWRGFARAIEDEAELTAEGVAKGFAGASETAYKGVVRPVEGTILTVSKDLAVAAEAALKDSDDPVKILEAAVEGAAASVEHTPELLPILKEAGVVDSGGKGLFFILEGMVRWINGIPLDEAEVAVQPLSMVNLDHAMEEVEEGQDWELVIDFQPNNPFDLQAYYDQLETMGTSIQVGEGDGMYRMHIHVPEDAKYQPWEYTETVGTITNIAVENLMAQMEEIGDQAKGGPQLAAVESNQIAAVAISPGSGISNVFASLGVAALVEGGQTMNPSTQDILAAFENLPASKVVILPNNKNIIMAAQAAADLTVKEVEVIKSRTVPQGLAAMLRLNPNGDFESVVADMQTALDEVETGEVTTATRNVEIDGVQVKEGQIIALHNGKLVLAHPDLKHACLELLNAMGMDDFELITLFYGETVNKNQAVMIADQIRMAYPEHEVEIQPGGQPHYQFIFSVE